MIFGKNILLVGPGSRIGGEHFFQVGIIKIPEAMLGTMPRTIIGAIA